MARAKYVVDVDGKFIGVRIQCPGCLGSHILPVNPTPVGYEESEYYKSRYHWNWNRDLEFPTFSPSIFHKMVIILTAILQNVGVMLKKDLVSMVVVGSVYFVIHLLKMGVFNFSMIVHMN